VCLCYKVLIRHQCAKLSSLSFKSYNFKDKSLGKLYKQTQAGSITVLLDTGILRNVVKKAKTHMFCCDSQNGLKNKKKAGRLSMTVEKARLLHISDINTSTGGLYYARSCSI